ncbi:MAG: NnrS family protein, partial [Gallionella sp.]
VFSMARRVMPFFIERGVGYPVKLKNRLWLDRSIIYVFVLFWFSDVIWKNAAVTASLAGLLFVAHTVRLAGWHTRGIWKKPLLWVLYLGYGGATFGFLIKALTPFVFLMPFLDLHAFAVGGIALMTAGMMARISLGHTGRSLQYGSGGQQHSRLLAPAFILLAVTFVARVILPMFAPLQYMLWIGIAQAAWLFAFALLVWVYAPVLVKPRADGMPG